MENIKSSYYPETTTALEDVVLLMNTLHHSDDEHFIIEGIKHPDIQKAISTTREVFTAEYASLSEKSEYFYGCPISIYIMTYQSRLNAFLKNQKGVEEIHFILKESREGLLALPKYFKILGDEFLVPFNFALQSRYKFLKDRIPEGLTVEYNADTDQFHGLREVIGYDIEEPYPELFNSSRAFKAFNNYLKAIKRNIPEISFLKKSLEKYSLIKPITDNEFIDFLGNNNYLNSKEWLLLSKNHQLNSLSKSSTSSRLQLFDTLFSELIN